MSVLGFEDALDAPELQIWHNAAFDNGESEDSTAIKTSWSNLRSDFVNQSLESDCSKENQSPVAMKPSAVPSRDSAVPIKPLHSSNIDIRPLENSLEAPTPKLKAGKGKEGEEAKRREEKSIDAEIEEIEKEIGRLSAKLEALRLEKAEQTIARNLTSRSRVVPAKFMEQKQTPTVKRFGDSAFSNTKPKMERRGASLGPAEIYAASKSRQLGKTETMLTPVQTTQNRRKSCFWKLEDIDEERGGRRMSFSVSPKSRKAVTTVRAVKKNENNNAVLSAVQPKNLFKDGEKEKTAKKPSKSGRFVASRYSNINNNQNNNPRKRWLSVADNDRDETDRVEKRRASQENGTNQKSEGRVKKRWAIPSACDNNGTTPYKLGNELRKIRTLRCIAESPRDSGPAAKRMAELERRKEGGDFGYVCQALSFGIEDADEE